MYFSVKFKSVETEHADAVGFTSHTMWYFPTDKGTLTLCVTTQLRGGKLRRVAASKL